MSTPHTFLGHMQYAQHRNPPFTDAEIFAAALVYGKLFHLPDHITAQILTHHLGMQFTANDVNDLQRIGGSKAIRKTVLMGLESLGVSQTDAAQVLNLTEATISYHKKRMKAGNGLTMWYKYTHPMLSGKREEYGKLYSYNSMQNPNNNFL